MQFIGALLIIVVIGLYLWWIYYTKNVQGAISVVDDGKQVFNIIVKGVYTPAVLQVEVNKPVVINFVRQEDTACSRFVVFPDFKIRKELPKDKQVTVEFTPEKVGEFIFTCDMGMYQGKLIVK